MGLIYKKHYILGDDIFEQLDDNSNKYKLSEMLKRTIYDESQNNKYCDRTFNTIYFSPGGQVHSCCAGWLPIVLGNLIKQFFDEIWNSALAKIIRLSMINKTFSFCNLNDCFLNSTVV